MNRHLSLRAPRCALSLLLLGSALSTPALAQRPPATCPEIADQLSELLASAKQRVGRDGEVRLELQVDDRGRARPLAIEGDRPYRTPVRLAVDSLECQPGEPQRYVLNIRFQDPAPRAAVVAQR